ncbi:DnaK suppressor protein [Photorhabdus khanii NC19]|uniref:DnaK suppressor protein n=1 Tax=Photorhabdus khanii NC19 TaxID=1004151 RepID=W3VA75_9GAMM|nr:TraR/DksA C4-type zinc finger protein [Photorhabdus khanii]ETS31949.1 DnaK suppressor protein [Photorhabdus khanii NC19]
MSRLIDQAYELEQYQRELALRACFERPVQTGNGFCHDCGEAIASARLAINPAFERCIGCQKQVELRGKKFSAGLT